jgi:hypothetical protein
MKLYEHTQVGFVTIIAVSTATVVFLAFLAAGRIAVPLAAIAGACVIAPISLALFGTLTVSVDEKRIQLRFGVGLIRKSIPISRIASFTPIHLRWVHGYGIHWLPFRGWLYNVSGFKAVEIVTSNGKHTLIGTDEPDALCRALQQAAAAEKQTGSR